MAHPGSLSLLWTTYSSLSCPCLTSDTTKMCAFVCVGAYMAYVLVCHMEVCTWTYFMCMCVWFPGANTGRNHVWWISTLAFVSCTFSSGWLMGLLTDVCANLLLLPLLHDLHVCVHACLHQWISVLCISRLWLYFPTSAYALSTCLLNRTGRK